MVSAEEQPNTELAAETRVHRAAEALFGAHRTRRHGEAGRQRRHEQDRAHRREKRAADGAEQPRVEADREADGDDEESDRRKRQGQAGRERRRPARMLVCRSRQGDGRQRQHAGRQGREHARERAEAGPGRALPPLTEA